MEKKIGVSGMALYVPRPCVSLDSWCSWTGNSPGKMEAVVGRSFRIPEESESVYTMAATAALRLILQYDIDPRQVGFLALGTESSTDNSAGAIIIRGMLDQALVERGLPPLSRNCEVPEVKHACLGGVYAQKAALRWLALDGAGRQALVVAADHAEYERDSSGEPTQGAGAVAILLEEDPALYAVDLRQSGSSSAYRGADFRKPVRRFSISSFASGTTRIHDFPVFSGQYSTSCYIDACVHAADDLMERLGQPHRSVYDQIKGAFLHRPYRRMPSNALSALYLWGLSRDADGVAELARLCEDAGVELEVVLSEMRSSPDLFNFTGQGRNGRNVYPASMELVRAFRRTPVFRERIEGAMSLGADRMMDLGNLYTASLPAWIASGFVDALEKGVELDGAALLTMGYGSGDAAEAVLITAQPGWQEAASRINLEDALSDPVMLSQSQYEMLHDRGAADLPQPPSDRFFIERIGTIHEPDFQDVGVEYYQYAR